MLFYSLETELRRHLPSAASESSGVKDVAMDNVLENDDVQLYWSLISENWVDEEADALLKIIAEHWITVRGFSHTSSFMEKYKLERKQTLQKSKGLRKTLLPKPATDKETDNTD